MTSDRRGSVSAAERVRANLAERAGDKPLPLDHEFREGVFGADVCAVGVDADSFTRYFCKQPRSAHEPPAEPKPEHICLDAAWDFNPEDCPACPSAAPAQPNAPAQREPVPDFEVWRERALLAEGTIKQWGPLIRGWLEPRSKDLNMVLEENAWLREKFENLLKNTRNALLPPAPEPELDSPNSVPPELEEFAARGYKRINRAAPEPPDRLRNVARKYSAALHIVGCDHGRDWGRDCQECVTDFLHAALVRVVRECADEVDCSNGCRVGLLRDWGLEEKP